jgi:hypothetical protein
MIKEAEIGVECGMHVTGERCAFGGGKVKESGGVEEVGVVDLE